MPFKAGQSGNPKGRPKGAKDKIARTAKENIEKVVNELGGYEGILTWAEKNYRNQGLLYSWYFKMLPSNVGIEGSIKHEHRISITDLKKSINNYDNRNSK